jgi:hypothetical protein
VCLGLSESLSALVRSEALQAPEDAESPKASANNEGTGRHASDKEYGETFVRQITPPNGHAAQLRPTALTANAGARRPPPGRYHGLIGPSCWVSAATAC